MSDSKYSKVTLNQLDINAIADFVVQSKKLVYRIGDHTTSDNKSQDVDKVADIDANRIAVAVSSSDRTTVQNALCLNGIDAKEYLTTATGASIATKQDKMEISTSTDISDLRDELYQLKNDLLKAGAIPNYGQYEGYIDTFKRNHYINLQDKICDCDFSGTNNDEFIVSQEDLDKFNPYDFVSVVSNEIFEVKQVKRINYEKSSIILDSDLRAEIREGLTKAEVYKSTGIIHNGMYCFASKPETHVGSQEFHTGLSDDTYNVVKRINVAKKGYGYKFRVPEAKQGYVTSFEICAKATGSPGALQCYIIDSRDINKFFNPAQAENDYNASIKNQELDGFRFFAKSNPYVLDSSLGKRYINFNFLQQNGSYPLMTRDDENETVTYVAIIEALEADSSNYYDIIFLQHKNSSGELGDLELNNITYNYKRQGDNSSEIALSTDDEINKYDMYYHITTKSTVENEPEAQKQGLYTARYSFVNTKKDINARKARLTLRIKREGIWNINTDSLVPKVYNNEVINVVNQDSSNSIKIVDDLRLKTDIYKRIETRKLETNISETVNTIIGNNICTVDSFNTSTITTKNPVLVNNNDKVYRAAYLVTLKARKSGMVDNSYVESEYDNYVMNLTEVIKDFEEVDKKLSDRLIFECDLEDKGYNDFEIQIFWENRELSAYADIRRDQMGAIKDLVLSFVRGC